MKHRKHSEIQDVEYCRCCLTRDTRILERDNYQKRNKIGSEMTRGRVEQHPAPGGTMEQHSCYCRPDYTTIRVLIGLAKPVPYYIYLVCLNIFHSSFVELLTVKLDKTRFLLVFSLFSSITSAG